MPLVYTFFTALTPTCCAGSYPNQLFKTVCSPTAAAADKLVLLPQAVPKPAAVGDIATAADQPRDENLPSTNRSGKAKKSQRQKGKGSGSRPMLQPPVLCSVLPCLQKLELHITGGYITSCLHQCACIIMLAVLCLHCCVPITMLALLCLHNKA